MHFSLSICISPISLYLSFAKNFLSINSFPYSFISIPLFLSLFLSHLFFPYSSLSLPFHVTLSLHILLLPHYLSPFPYLFLSTPIFPCLYLFLYFPLYLYLYPYLFIYLFLSISLSIFTLLSLYFPFSLPLQKSSFPLSPCPPKTPSLPLFILLFIFPTLTIIDSLSLSPFLHPLSISLYKP